MPPLGNPMTNYLDCVYCNYRAGVPTRQHWTASSKYQRGDCAGLVFAIPSAWQNRLWQSSRLTMVMGKMMVVL